MKEFSLQVMKQNLLDSKQYLLKEKREKHGMKMELDMLRQQLSKEMQSSIASSRIEMGLHFKMAGAGFRIPIAQIYN